jgi:hypothetical protein
VHSQDKNLICESIAGILQDKPDGNRAWKRSAEAWAQLEDAERALEEKQGEIEEKEKEIKEKRLSKEEQKRELSPLREGRAALKALRDERLYEWASLIRPELTIRDLTKFTESEYREYASRFLLNRRNAEREPLDFLSAFGSDACLEYNKSEKKWQISSTLFCFVRGSGHQYFLETVRHLMKEATVERVRSVLFDPWTYTDSGLSLRWDPKEAARYSLMDVDPGPLGASTVWMANLLAYRALALFPSTPSPKGLRTTGWSLSDREFFTWPIWEKPSEPDTIRSLMLLRELSASAPDRSVLRARGIAAAFRAERIKVGSRANFKINFSLSRGV